MKTAITFLVLTFALHLHAQDFSYLMKINLDQEGAFKDHEDDLIKSIDFLMSAPVDKDDVNRKFCSAFIVLYAEKSPDVSVVLQEPLIQVSDKTPDLFMMFLGLWVKAELQNPDQSVSFYEESCYTELANYCAQGNNVKKTKTIQSLINAGESKTISAWIAEKRG